MNEDLTGMDAYYQDASMQLNSASAALEVMNESFTCKTEPSENADTWIEELVNIFVTIKGCV